VGDVRGHDITLVWLYEIKRGVSELSWLGCLFKVDCVYLALSSGLDVGAYFLKFLTLFNPARQRVPWQCGISSDLVNL